MAEILVGILIFGLFIFNLSLFSAFGNSHRGGVEGAKKPIEGAELFHCAQTNQGITIQEVGISHGANN
jgi:hypothetical protein